MGLGAAQQGQGSKQERGFREEAGRLQPSWLLSQAEVL